MNAAHEAAQTLAEREDAYLNEIDDGVFLVGGNVEVKDLGGGLIEVTNLRGRQSATTRSVALAVERGEHYMGKVSHVDERDEHDQDAPVRPVLDDSHLRNE